MATITCPNTECIHNNGNYKCQCKKVELSFWNVATVNDGRRDFWVCKNYEMSDEAKALEDNFLNFLKSRGQGEV